MKKHKLKNLLKCGILLFGISLILANCSDDETFTDNDFQNNSDYTIKLIPEEQYNKNSKLSKHIEKFKKGKSNLMNRDVYNSEYDFTVDTDFAKYVESSDGTNHSYTFRIIGTVDDNTEENLVISLQPDGTYNAEIIEYKFVDETNLEIRKANLNINANDFLSRGSFSYSCTTTVSYHYEWNFSVSDCPNGPCQELVIDSASTSCTYQYNYIEAGPSGGGGGGWSGTVITSGGGGGTNTGTTTGTATTTTTTSPFTNKEEIFRRQKLLEISSNPVVKSKIDELAPKVFSDISNNYQEDGARFKLIGENEYTPREPNETLNQGVNYTPDYLEKEIVSVHIHQQKFWDMSVSGQPFFNSPVFSDGDIVEFLENIEYIENTDSDLTNDVTSIILSEIGAFALVVDDKQLADDAINALQNDETYNDFIDDFERKVLKKWRKGNCDNDCIVKKTTKFINTYEINGQNLGIHIYQASIINNQIVFWNKK